MVELIKNKTIGVLYIVQLMLLFFAIMPLAMDGIIQIATMFVCVIFFILGIINIFIVWIAEEKYAWLFTIFAILQFIIFIWIAKPMFHGLLMWFYVNPWIIELLLISFILGFITWITRKLTYHKKDNYYDRSNAGFWAFCIFAISFVIILIVFALLSAYPSCYLAQNLDVQEIDELPDMDMDFLRITPMKVSDRYATDACQYPRHTPSIPSDITMINGTPYWAYLLVPDGMVNAFNIKPKGAVFIDMSTTEKSLEMKECEFEISPDIELTDNIYWKIHELNYWAECERTMVVLHENELYLVIPYIEYDLQFTFPMFYRVPKWGGVFLVDSTGDIKDLSPSEAMESPILQGQKLFPEKLVLTYIESQRFWRSKSGDFVAGITNTWWDHDDEIAITDVYDQGNSQPFLLNTKDGLKWFVSCEPYGQAHGIYRIYIIDARTGLIEMKQYSRDEIGPVKACNYARTDNPMVDWSRFQVVEPIPVTPNGELYWEVRIVPDDGSGISYISFVNPRTGKVTECKTDMQIHQFLQGKAITNETKNDVKGSIIDIDTFIQDGNTRWVININGTTYIAQAEDFEFDTLLILSNLEIGDTITIKYTNDRVIISIFLV